MAAFWRDLTRALSNDFFTFAQPREAARVRGQKKASPKARLARAAAAVFESLEDRRLLAVLPAPDLADISHTTLIGPTDNVNYNTPSVAHNPSAPNQLVSVFVRNDPGANGTQKVFIGGRFSVDGGLTWTNFNIPGNQIQNPQSNPADPDIFAQATSPSIAFDRNNNFYVLYMQHTADQSAGALVIRKFDMAGGTPAAPLTPAVQPTILYRWTGNDDRALTPMLAVDSNLPTYTDATTGLVQTDPYVNNVYVAYATNDTAPDQPNNYNPNTIRIMASSDGGVTYSTPILVNDSGHSLPSRAAAPRLVVSQGTPLPVADPLNTARVMGGQVTIVWDDFNVLRGANPPLDRIVADRIQDGGTGYSFADTVGKPIVDATDPGGGGAHNSANTDSAVTVNIPVLPTPLAITDMDVVLNAVHYDLAHVSVTLIPPAASGLANITLVRARTDTAGNSNNNIGISGVGLGVVGNTFNVGTYFDASASRSIFDGGAPYAAHFRPDNGNLNLVNGLTGTQVNGLWTLRITDNREGPATPANSPAPRLRNWSLNFTTGLTTGADTTVTTTSVLGNPFATPNLAPNAMPELGVQPGATVASDNTLGSFSPYQGRLYVAYTGRLTAGGNPADNTDVYLMSSDDGGATWATASLLPVNDDNSATDGFSESIQGGARGRLQFQPNIAVDQTTGTLAVTYFDARWDAARSRLAQSLSTSIDGGATFGKSVYVNRPNAVLDSVTGETVNLHPRLDNQSGSNGGRDQTFSFGQRQGLTVYGGHVYSVWAGNEDAGNLRIFGAVTPIAAGPRIVSSTMGPVSLAADTLNPATASGPQAQAFLVTFDRPVDPDTFTRNLVRVQFRDVTTSGNSAPVDVPVLAVTPLDFDVWGPADAEGATQFRIDFTPSSAVGTYSYYILPGVRDRVRGETPTALPMPVFTYSAEGPQINLPISDLAITNSTIAASAGAAKVGTITVNINLTHTFDSDMVLTLVSPTGTRITLADSAGGAGDNFTNTTFSDAATVPIANGTAPFTGTFRPEVALAGLAGEDVTGTWTLEIDDQVGADSGLLLGWSINVTPQVAVGPIVYTPIVAQTNLPVPSVGTGGAGTSDDITLSSIDLAGVGGLVTNARVTVNLTHAETSDLTLTLISPTGTRILLSDQNGAGAGGYTTTIFDDAALTAVAAGAAPFNGSFQPEDLLSTLNGENPNGSWRLEIIDNNPLNGGTLVDWSLELTTGAIFVDGNSMDQDADTSGGELATVSGTYGDVYAIPGPADQTSYTTDGLQYWFRPGYDSRTLPLIVPGPHLVSSAVGAIVSGTDTPVLDGPVSFFDVVFDRDMDPAAFTPAKVLRLQTPIGAISGPFTITPNPLATDPDPLFPRTYRIGFAAQTISGSYTVTLDSTITDKLGEGLDTNLNAGVDVLRDSSNVGTLISTTSSPAMPISATNPGGITESPLEFSDAFVIQPGTPATLTSAAVPAATVQINITHTNDPDLQIWLVAPDDTEILLVDRIGLAGTRQNFTNTIFDDFATTPIQNGGAPFFGRFNPTLPLSVLAGKSSVGAKPWRLRIKDNAAGNNGTLVSWSLSLKKPVPATGLQELVSDQVSASFRIFAMSPTNPVSHNAWTPVGPASSAGNSGRIGGLAMDPSDPTGNTIYVGGASGGIWKTSNFLTSDPQGPTWIPLTDFGPTWAINIGGIAVFGRNNDTRQSVVFGVTGEGDVGSPGVGFIRSMDGGATWTLLDSTTNVDASGNLLPINSPLRDHIFVGATSFKVSVDPRPTPSGEVVVYAALSGAANKAGIWRSVDSGKHWQRMLAGQADDVTLDLASGVVNAVSNPTGNVDIVYAALRGDGIYISPNRGQVWNKMLGVTGNPLIRDANTTPATAVPVTAEPSGGPSGAKGRIVMVKPEPLGDPLKDVQYQGWLYALVSNPAGALDGLFMTKDFGQNWTKIRMPGTLVGGVVVPTNAPGTADYPIFGTLLGQGNYDLSIGIDPNDPNVVYVGGKRDGVGTNVMRVDTTGVSDAHAWFRAYDRADNTGTISNNDPVGIINPARPVTTLLNLGRPDANGMLSLTRDPGSPFLANSTIYVRDTERFYNTGTGAIWTPFMQPVVGNDHHRMITFRDPLTGKARIVFGNDHTVSSGVDDEGTYTTGIGTARAAFGNRTGNLQIGQLYYGAVQPSALAAQAAGAMFYGANQDDGAPASEPGVLTDGDINWGGGSNRGDSGGVATDQTGSGTVYRYNWPCCGGGNTDFFQVNGVGRTFGLLQPGDDPASGGTAGSGQWPFLGTVNFAVNPVNGDQIIISSTAGRIFGTSNQGRFWLEIGNPAALDGSQSLAMAYGAPDPGAATGALNNFMYVGTNAGNIFVTFTGGGANGNQWINLSNGLQNDGSAVQQIVTNPLRGSHEAYAVTRRGVYHMADATAVNATWVNITSNLFNVTHDVFMDPSLNDKQARSLHAVQADWRYVIPDTAGDFTGPTHPVLYVGGEGGVYRSLDKGQTWSLFPSMGVDDAAREGGYLPNAHVTDMDMSLGNIDPTTGRAINTVDAPNILMASTYGRGAFAIRLAPLIIPNTLTLNPADDTGISPTDRITSVTQLRFSGVSQQSAFGAKVRVTILDLTDPNNPVIIGGYDGTPATDTAANRTDEFGKFNVQINAGAFATDGAKVIGIRAEDEAGVQGRPVEFNITIDTTAPAGITAPFNAVEGTPFSGVIASFPDEPRLGSALINWGDGVTSTGAIVPRVGGGYDIRGTHTYADPGTYNVTVTATDAVGNVGAIGTTATVANPAVVITGGLAFTASEGTLSAVQTVARFTDPGGAEALTEYAADINWGDGQTSLGTITYDPVTGIFSVRGAHLYAASGAFTITTTVHHDATSLTPAPDATGTSTAQVLDTPVVVVGGTTFTGVEGSLSAVQNVATFTDADVQALGTYSATINWGDGTSSAGTITFDAINNRYIVSGAHKYNEEGTFQITTVVAQTNSPDASAASTANISDPAVIATAGANFTAGRTVPATVIVATFTDPGGPDPITPTEYSATITWGDGQTSAGVITLDANTGIYTVRGTNTYATQGTFTVTTTIRHASAPNVVVSNTATVTPPPVQFVAAASYAGVEAVLGASRAIATFRDPLGALALNQYSADIVWGDGATTAGVITFNAQTGIFTVSGAHLYADPGNFPLSVVVHRPGVPDGISNGTAAISNPAVIATGNLTLRGFAGQITSSQTVATFTDPGGPEALNQYSALVSFGDGQTAAGVITFDAGTGLFTVKTDHLYNRSGIFTMTVRISHTTAPDAVVSSRAVISIPYNGAPFASVEGVLSPLQTVATFTDPGQSPALSTYSADIEWGDGTTSLGTLSVNPATGLFTVTGSHLYNDPGTIPITVIVHRLNSPDTIISTTAEVANPQVIGTGGFVLNGQKGVAVPISTVATFTDPGGPEPLGDYVATIDWGDGTTSLGTITYASTTRVYTVRAGHTFVAGGLLTINTTVTHDGGAATVISSTANILQPSLVVTGGQTISGVEGQNLVSRTLATFTDPSGNGPTTAYVADIDWGDGQTSAGTIVFDNANSRYVVQGTHQYQRARSYVVKVNVARNTGNAAAILVTSTANITDAPITASAVNIASDEVTAFDGIVARFGNTNPFAGASEFTARIDWGDGTSPTTGIVTVDPNDATRFVVRGAHAFADGTRTFAGNVRITDGSATATSALTSVIANSAPTASLTGPATVFVGQTATFTLTTNDAAQDRAAGFTLRINWGDGSAVQTVTGAAAGARALTRAYSTAGNRTITVQVTDRDGASTTKTLNVSVVAPPTVSNVVINSGNRERSRIDRIQFTINSPAVPVNSLSINNLKLVYNGNRRIGLGAASLSYNAATHVAILDLRNLVLADGDYQLQVQPVPAALLAISFHKLTGDANGDRRVNNSDVSVVNASLGRSPGQAGYDPNANLDRIGGVTAADLSIVQNALGRTVNVAQTSYTIGQAVPTINFGTIARGSGTRWLDLLIFNPSGASTKTISSITPSSGYTFAPLTGLWDQPFAGVTLGGNQSYKVRVYFVPGTTGTFNGSLTLRIGSSNVVVPLKAVVQ